MFEYTTCFGTFKTRGLTSSTKQESLMQDLAKYKLDFLLLQEAKITNELSLKRENNNLLSFKPTNKHYGFG